MSLYAIADHRSFPGKFAKLEDLVGSRRGWKISKALAAAQRPMHTSRGKDRAQQVTNI